MESNTIYYKRQEKSINALNLILFKFSNVRIKKVNGNNFYYSITKGSTLSVGERVNLVYSNTVIPL